MTIKQFINKYFEDNVEFDEDTGLFYEQDFWRTWDKLEEDMDKGIQWCFEWYEEQPTLTKAREEFIKKAVKNYIDKNLLPVYTTNL